MDQIQEWQTIFEHINIEAMIVDLLTKGLTPKLFNEHVINKGVLNSFDVLG